MGFGYFIGNYRSGSERYYDETAYRNNEYEKV